MFLSMSSSSRFAVRRLAAPAATTTGAALLLVAVGGSMERKAIHRTTSAAAQRMLSSSSSSVTTSISRRFLALQQPKVVSTFPASSRGNNNNCFPLTMLTRSFSTKPTTTPTTASTKAAAPTTMIQPSTSSSSSSGGGFVAWYEGHLQTRPVVTKMVTGSFLWGIGDAVAQIVPAVATGKFHTSSFQYDTVRTARAAFFGFALHAPLSHLHFNFLEWMTVRAGYTGLQIPVFKTIMEQFVYWSWVSNSLYHGAMGLLQGFTFQQCYDRIADVLWETQKAQWVFWIPIQLINFQFTPVRHQLNVVLLTSIVWTALLSAWYPPQDDEEGSEGEGGEVDDEAKKLALQRRKSSLMTQQDP